MKCSSPLTTGGSCGMTARFQLGARPYCRRHAAENIFQRVLAEKPLQDTLMLKKLGDE